MRFFTTLAAVIAFITLSIAAPLTSRDVMNDITECRLVVAALRGHLGGNGLDLMVLANDNLAMTRILDRITNDALAVRAFNEADATDIISRTSQLASDIDGATTLLISKSNSISGVLRNAVAQSLQLIINHAKAAGDALVGDCPADRKADAERVYLQISTSLNKALRSYAS